MPQQKFNKLAGKHVLIIGGTAGIGYCVAEGCIESGASVTISSSTQSRVSSAVKSLQSAYPDSKVRGFICDLSKDTVEQDIEKLFEQTGNVDHIVFTAGDKLAMKPIHEITLESIKAAGQVRLFAPLLVAKVGSKYLSAGPEASIVLTTGTVGDHPNPNWSIVAAYASGLHGMTRNLALDLKPIRVNLVSPGAVDTELWRDMPAEDKEKMFKALSAKLPTGRVAKPESVAEAYLFLMKDSNVTGTVISSNSGSLLV